MSEDLPLVSIITACFNSADYIEDNMASVAAQTYPNLEHVFVDGGSTDGTVDLIREYAKNHRVTWVSEPDDGPAPATVKGIKMASGEIVGMLPSDDTMYPWSAATGADYLVKHPKVDLVHGDIVTIDPSGENVDIRLHKPFNRNFMLRTQCMPSMGTFFRKHILEDTAGAEEAMSIGDFGFWMAMSEKHEIRNVSEVMAMFRKRSDSFTGAAGNQALVQSKINEVRSKYANPQSRFFRAMQFWDRVYGAFYRRLLLTKLIRRSSKVGSRPAEDDSSKPWSGFLGLYDVSFASKGAFRNLLLPNRRNYDTKIVPRSDSDDQSP